MKQAKPSDALAAEDEVLRRMLTTPHKPHADKPAPGKKAAPKSPVRPTK